MLRRWGHKILFKKVLNLPDSQFYPTLYTSPFRLPSAIPNYKFAAEPPPSKTSSPSSTNSPLLPIQPHDVTIHRKEASYQSPSRTQPQAFNRASKSTPQHPNNPQSVGHHKKKIKIKSQHQASTPVRNDRVSFLLLGTLQPDGTLERLVAPPRATVGRHIFFFARSLIFVSWFLVSG